MNGVPQERDAEAGTPPRPYLGNLLVGQPGSVVPISCPVAISLSLPATAADASACESPHRAASGGREATGAVARLEEVRGGGRERRVREDGTAAGGRWPAAGEREAVPSAGWRSVARALAAEEGMRHG
jgi:hypothetical protein